jgi:dTDP-4-dehydrorhamnose reductase
MAKIAVLGSTGMLGSTMARVLTKSLHGVYEFNRSGISVVESNSSFEFDVTKIKKLSRVFSDLEIDYIVNCIGMIKQVINNDKPEDIALAEEVNSNFLEEIESFSKKYSIKVIQIGTDCVYSGQRGKYLESDTFDPTDVYGITKSIGERYATSSMLIRCSIIGRELSSKNSLMEWVLNQPLGAKINGYTNHIWNGVTTLQFSQIVLGIIESNSFKEGIQHLIPKDTVSKYELINIIAGRFDRRDLSISKFRADYSIDRSLATNNLEQNLQLWQLGGYNEVPTIDEMVTAYTRWMPLQQVKNQEIN